MTQDEKRGVEDDTRSAGRGLLWVASGKVFFIVTALGVQFALPRLFGSQEAYGLFAVAFGAASMLNNVLIASTLQTVSKLVSEDEQRAPRVLRQGLGLQAAIGALLGGGLTLAAPTLATHVLLDPELETLIRIGGGNLKSVMVLGVIALIAYFMINPFPGSDQTLYSTLFYSWTNPTAVALSTHQDLGAMLFSDNVATGRMAMGGIVGVLLLAAAPAARASTRSRVTSSRAVVSRCPFGRRRSKPWQPPSSGGELRPRPCMMRETTTSRMRSTMVSTSLSAPSPPCISAL